MKKSCYHNSRTPDLKGKLNNKSPQQHSISNNTFAIKTQTYQTKINELEKNVQISFEGMNKLNSTIQNLVTQVEGFNKQLEKMQKLQQVDTKKKN